MGTISLLTTDVVQDVAECPGQVTLISYSVTQSPKTFKLLLNDHTKSELFFYLNESLLK